MIIAYKHPFVGLFVMSCGTCCFVVSLWPFCFIAVTWPKMANRPNKEPKKLEFIENSFGLRKT